MNEEVFTQFLISKSLEGDQFASRKRKVDPNPSLSPFWTLNSQKFIPRKSKIESISIPESPPFKISLI